jgi:WD40 repeat protein
VWLPTRVLQVKPSPRLRATRDAHKEGVSHLCFSPDGKTLASAGLPGEVSLWDAPRLERRAALPQQGQANALAFTPDGKRLLVSSYEPLDEAGKWLRIPYDPRAVTRLRGGVRVFDVHSGKPLGWLRRDPQRAVLRLYVTADGKTAALQEYARGAKDEQPRRTTALWDLATGKPRRELPGEDVLYGMTPDGKTLVRFGEKGAVLWDVEAGKARAKLTRKGEYVGPCVFSRDSKTMAGILEGQGRVSVAIWDVGSGKRVKQLKADALSYVRSLALSADGAWLATGQGVRSRTVVEPSDVLLWDVKTGRRVVTLRGHVNGVLTLAFHPNGKRLASGGSDGSVRLWDVGGPEEKPGGE